MFTKEQVRKISRYYIEPLFYRTSCIIGIDADEGLTNGHCYYYAERLVKFLQGKWRNVGTEYLSDEEKDKILVCFARPIPMEVGKYLSFHAAARTV